MQSNSNVPVEREVVLALLLLYSELSTRLVVSLPSERARGLDGESSLRSFFPAVGGVLVESLFSVLTVVELCVAVVVKRMGVVGGAFVAVAGGGVTTSEAASST